MGGVFSIVLFLIALLFASCSGGTDYVGTSSAGSYTVTFETDGGSTVAAQTVESGKTATEPATPKKDGFNFSGWYTDSALTDEFSFTTKITADTTLYAKWIPDGTPTFSITFDKNGSDATGTMADKTGSQGATVTLPASSFKNGFLTFKKWNTAADGSGTSYADGADVVLSADMTLYAVWEYEFHETVTALDAGTDGTAGTGASYVYFGDFPNTIKASAVTVSETKTKVMGGLTYYLGSDGYWYAKCAENAYEANYTYSNGTTVGQGSTSEKYFRAEPIKWRVLTENYTDATRSPTGKKLLLAENILTAKRYAASSNDYKNSEIRSWLNNATGLLGSAFTSSAQALIATTSVDNSAASTNPASNESQWNGGENQYASSTPTSDKIFLLSEKEVTDYGFEAYDASGAGNTRIRVTTDWARANYAYQSGTAGYGGWWWLRSPYCNNSSHARVVYIIGFASDGSSVSVREGWGCAGFVNFILMKLTIILADLPQGKSIIPFKNAGKALCALHF